MSVSLPEISILDKLTDLFGSGFGTGPRDPLGTQTSRPENRMSDSRPKDAPAEAEVPTFDAIYREQRGRLIAVVRSVVGDSDELEDVLQLVFIEIHRCLPRFEGRSRLSTWLYRISVNVALQHLRKRRRKRWLVLGAMGDEDRRHAAPGDDRLRLEDRQLLREVERSLDTLTDKKRVVWQLHELQGLEPHEIGEILDIPTNTVRSRLLAARKEVMEDLERRGVVAKKPTPKPDQEAS